MDQQTVSGTKPGRASLFPVRWMLRAASINSCGRQTRRSKPKVSRRRSVWCAMCYSIDVKNMYRVAYEERILNIKIEEERGQATKDAERRAEEKMESELKRRMNEFYKSMQMETIRKKQLESKEQNLEDQARQASVGEQQEIVQKGMAALQADMRNSISELEKGSHFRCSELSAQQARRCPALRYPLIKSAHSMRPS